MQKQRNKRFIIFFIFLMTALAQAGVVLYTPAFLKISEELNITPTFVKTTITAYLVGFGFSQLIYGPLSDRIGRKKPLLLGLSIFAFGCLGSIVSTSYFQLLSSRVVQGVGAGSCMTLARTILRDSFKGMEYIKKASYLSSGFALGLGLAPIVGGLILSFFSWRGEFVFLFILNLLLFIFFWLYLPETHQIQPKLPFIKFCKNTFFHFLATFKNKHFVSYLLGGVLAYGVVIAYTTMTPFLFQKTMGYSANFFAGLTFIMALFYYAGTSFTRKLIHQLGADGMIKLGLSLILFSGLCLLFSNLLFGLFNIYIVVIPLALAIFGQALVWSNCIAGALKDLSHIAGTATAFFSCLQMLLAAFVSGLIAIPHESNQIPIGLVIILLGVTSWLILYPFVIRD